MNIPESRKRFLRNFARDELRLSSNAPMKKILQLFNMNEEQFYPAMEDKIVAYVQSRDEKNKAKDEMKKAKRDAINAKRRAAYALKKSKKTVPKPIIYKFPLDASIGFDGFKNIIQKFMGKSIHVKLEDNPYNEEHEYDVPNTDKEFTKFIYDRWYAYHDFVVDSDTDKLTSGFLVISIGNKIHPSSVSQEFREGTTNCMLTPILNWASEKLNEAKSDRTKDRYKKICIDVDALLKKYIHGVPQDKINEICNFLKISISVELPFQKVPYISEKPETKALTSFKFINLRHDHVDEVVDMKNVTFCDVDGLINIMKTCDSNNGDYYYTKNNKTINCVYTNVGVYKLNNNYSEFISEFETKNNIHGWKIDALKYPELTRFIDNSTHYNCCMDFEQNSYDHFINGKTKFSDMKHIDQKACYKNVKFCKYYTGFLAKISDFRYTNKIQTIGIYLITNIVIINEKFRKLNDEMKFYVNNNSYPSPALDFLSTVGTYDIIGGCWGMRGDLDMDYENEKGNFMMKDQGVPYYSKYIGACNSIKYEHKYYLQGDEKTAQIIRANTNTDVWRFSDNINHTTPDSKCEIKVCTKKNTVKHLSHITSFVLEYARLNIIEQLMNMEFKNIIRVISDGIYYVGEHVTCYNNYRPEESDKFDIQTGKFTTYTNADVFCSNTLDSLDSYNYQFSKERDFYKNELAVGGGGSGKTHFNLLDFGLVNIMYIAPTWKLARNKAEEYKCKVGTHASLLMCDPTSNMFTDVNVLIIDEVSMMSNEEKTTIMNYYSDRKIIFCGDIDYQLPFVQSHKKGVHTKFTTHGFDNIMRFDIDYRAAKCVELKDMKIKIRNMIDLGDNWVEPELINKFKKISRDEMKSCYNINDMVLCSSHKKKDEYTTMFSHMNKYYITKTTNKYSCGEILITDEVIDKEFGAELRHAYTVHSIQGETCKTNLFIEAKNMDMRMFYTAISRAQYMNQIFIVE